MIGNGILQLIGFTAKIGKGKWYNSEDSLHKSGYRDQRGKFFGFVLALF